MDEVEVRFLPYRAELPNAALYPQRHDLVAGVNEQDLENGGDQMPVQRVVQIHCTSHFIGNFAQGPEHAIPGKLRA